MQLTLPDQNQVRLVDGARQSSLGHLARRGPIWTPAKPRWVAGPKLAQNGSATVGRLGASLVGAAFGAAVTYVGVRTGLKDKGLPQILGWVVGIGTGIATLIALGNMVTTGIELVGIRKPGAK